MVKTFQVPVARVLREREEREERRSQTQENTLSNSGVVIIFFVYYFSSQKLKQVLESFHLRRSLHFQSQMLAMFGCL